MRWAVCKLAGLAVAACALLSPALAQEGVRVVDVQLEAGSGAREFGGFIEAFEAVEYRITLHSGQRLAVQLASSNLSNSFDIHAPGAEKPQYESGVSGNQHELIAADAGLYRIRVYLLRLAARDGQEAEYTLTLTRKP